MSRSTARGVSSALITIWGSVSPMTMSYHNSPYLSASIQTEANLKHILTRPYLLKFREGRSIRFVPPQGVPQCPTQASPQRPKAGVTFSPHVDTCYHPMPQSFQPDVGLGIAGINPSSMCAWRLNGELISFCPLGCYPHIISARKMTDEILSQKGGICE
jgi:hypothetical protein